MDSAEHGALEALAAGAASTEGGAERAVRAESPARKTMRTATGGNLQ